MAPKCFFVQNRAHWCALCNMLLCKRLAWFFTPTFLNFICSNLSSFMSYVKILWCTNSKCSLPISFMQYPTIPKKVCNPSSLNLLHETTQIDYHNSLDDHLKCLCVNVPQRSMEHKPTMHSSMNFLNFTRNVTSMCISPTAIVMGASKYFKLRRVFSWPSEHARASFLEP